MTVGLGRIADGELGYYEKRLSVGGRFTAHGPYTPSKLGARSYTSRWG